MNEAVYIPLLNPTQLFLHYVIVVVLSLMAGAAGAAILAFVR